MYIAAGQGQTTLGDIFWCQQKPLVASVICYKFQKISLKSDFIQFFKWFYTCICLGADNPLGMEFLCQQEHLVILVICCKFQKNLFEVWFNTIVFMILYMYIALGQGQTAPRGADSPQGIKFWCQQKCLVTSSICCKFKKKCLWSLILYNFFHDLIHVNSPGAGAGSPQGTKFWCQQKCLVTSFICCKFQNNLCEVWFYTIFFMLLYIYIAQRQGLTTPWGWNFYVNRNILSLWSYVASFKKISLKSDFIHFFFFQDFIFIYSLGQGQTAPKGQSFDVNRNVWSLHSFVASFKKLSLKSDFIQFFSWFNTCI